MHGRYIGFPYPKSRGILCHILSMKLERFKDFSMCRFWWRHAVVQRAGLDKYGILFCFNWTVCIHWWTTAKVMFPQSSISLRSLNVIMIWRKTAWTWRERFYSLLKGDHWWLHLGYFWNHCSIQTDWQKHRGYFALTSSLNIAKKSRQYNRLDLKLEWLFDLDFIC